MVDFIKLNISTLSRGKLLTNPILRDHWMTQHNAEGEVRFRQAKVDNLTFKIFNEGHEVAGSLHKYYNLRSGWGFQNHSRYSIDQIAWTIDDLHSRFGIDPARTTIVNLEYGVNLPIDRSPTDLIRENMVTYGTLPITRLNEYGSKGYFTECTKTEYYFKIYDKSRQFSTPSDLLRMEVKTRKSRYFRSSGASVLSDLADPMVLADLMADLRKKIMKVKIVDHIDPVTVGMNDSEKELYLQGVNPNYWHELGERNSNRASRINSRFNKLLSKYGLLTTKEMLLDSFDNEVGILIQKEILVEYPPLYIV